MVIAAPTSVPAIDRRSATRRQPALGTVCHLATDSGEELGMGLVWNISSSGISMLLSQPVDPGTMVQGELRTTNDAFALLLSFRVAHVSRLRTGDFMLGGQFTRRLVTEEMRPFLG